jgi:hypothetical protein
LYRFLKKIFGPERAEDRSWRNLDNDELHSLYSSPYIFRVIQSRTMRWTGHVARMGEGRSVYRIFVGRPKGKRPLENLGVGGRITLRRTSGNRDRRGELDSVGSG